LVSRIVTHAVGKVVASQLIGGLPVIQRGISGEPPAFQ